MYGFEFVFIILCVLHLTEAGGRCFDCTRLPYARDCDHVTQCGQHEVCYTEQIVSHSGQIFYDSGCLDRATCFKKRASIVDDETGDLVVCLQCCEGNFCNSQGCGSPALPPIPTARGPICFNCEKGTLSPGDCDIVKVCGRDQMCSVEPFDIGGDHLYKTGCKSCLNVGGMLVGKRTAGTCSGCCSSDFCNQDCLSVSYTPGVTPTSVTQSSTHITESSSTTVTPQLTITTPTSNAPSTTTSLLTTRSTTTATTQLSSTWSTATSGTLSSTFKTTPRTTAASTSVVSKDIQCLLFGYEYLPQFHYCVKPYSDLMFTWQHARDRCIQDGGDLLIFHNKEEENFFQPWLKNITETDLRYWVGATDLEKEGTWLWIDNTPVDTHKYFFPGEPNDAGYPDGFHENCAASIYNPFTYNVLMNDINCTTLSNFICEVNLEALPHTPARAHCRNDDYVYSPTQGICYKVYNNELKSFAEARATCQREHADLLQLKDRHQETFFIQLGYDSDQPVNTRYWLGAIRQNSLFYWFNGHRVYSDTYQWGPKEPNNLNNNENCLDFTYFSKSVIALNDQNCETKSNFICEGSVSLSLFMGSNGNAYYCRHQMDYDCLYLINHQERCPDTTYTYIPAMDLCFKIHNTPSSWYFARDTCLSENASLAEPNTMQKMMFFDKYLKTLETEIYWVGATQDSKITYVFWWLTSNQQVSKDLWHTGEPNHPNEHCATLFWYKRTGLDNLFRLNDNQCYLNYSFICQYIW